MGNKDAPTVSRIMFDLVTGPLLKEWKLGIKALDYASRAEEFVKSFERITLHQLQVVFRRLTP